MQHHGQMATLVAKNKTHHTDRIRPTKDHTIGPNGENHTAERGQFRHLEGAQEILGLAQEHRSGPQNAQALRPARRRRRRRRIHLCIRARSFRTTVGGKVRKHAGRERPHRSPEQSGCRRSKSMGETGSTSNGGKYATIYLDAPLIERRRSTVGWGDPRGRRRARSDPHRWWRSSHTEPSGRRKHL